MPNDTGYREGLRTQTEEVVDARLPVESPFPDWLRGTFVGNGPGQFEVGGRSLVHWFDPLAMLRRFRFDDEGVRYSNRFVRSRDYEYARERGGVRTPFPGTPADRPIWTRIKQALTGTFPDNPVIGVQRLGDEYLAVTESPWGIAFDPDTLETTGTVDLTAGLDCDLTLAHVHYDHDADAFLNLGVSYGRETTYTLFRRPADGGAPTPLTRLRFDEAPYVHSFGLTDEYAVITVNPFGLDTTALLKGVLTGGTFLDTFGPLDAPTRFVVLDRETGAHETTVEAPPAFVYHHANAYERGGEVVVDLVVFPDDWAVTGLTLENLRSATPELPTGDLVRYRLPLDGGEAERRRLHEGPVEFPMIDYRRYGGRPYRYTYLAETGCGSSLPTGIVKVDVETEQARRWRESGTYPGEPVFVPAPDADDEDDGVLLSVLLEPSEDRSVLVCFDAATLSEHGRAPLPHRLPYGFHGQFYGPTAPGRSMP
ncbi:carotenoid oxygenase family protein [Halorarum halophilum]|uniref:Carotenoid oxygenase family protein n=1 Tax=Halorarum halophilum TaxID=2743090 RepID=A0A7D5K831_9EURY|nr:carotenoid oxygenase family protein [Halobaculum halophilum]QLG27854.1 carotenoid oxygenase family protein [Halobaculum halophilum]